MDRERTFQTAITSIWWIISMPTIWVLSTPYILLASIFTKGSISKSISNLYERLTRWWIISSASVARIECNEDEIGFLNRFSQYHNKIDFGDRLGSAFIFSILTLLTCIGVLLVLCAIPGSVGMGKIVIILFMNKWYWVSIVIVCVIAGIVGFILGSEKMTDMFGSLWGTNDKW